MPSEQPDQQPQIAPESASSSGLGWLGLMASVIASTMLLALSLFAISTSRAQPPKASASPQQIHTVDPGWRTKFDALKLATDQ